MANTKNKKIEELVAPTMPGEIDKRAVNAASANIGAASGALNKLNYDTFKQGSIYGGLKKSYEQQGRKAMQDTIGQVAARTGGMASSYATTAANQSYNNYMQALEDAARAEFNNEYSKARDKVDLAQQDYNRAYNEYQNANQNAWTRYNAEMAAYQDARDYNYKVGRDAISDERYEDSQTKERVSTQKTDLYNLVASGGTPNRNDFPDLTDADYNNIVATATNEYNTGRQSARNTELEGIFGAEGFIWGDWDGDGTVEGDKEGKTFEDLYGGSSYGEEYWENFYNTKAGERTKEATKTAQDEVMAILEAGGTPTAELLVKAGFLDEESAYSTDEDGNGIPDGLSGLAATMWQNNIDAENEANAAEADKTTKAAQDEVIEILKAGGTPDTKLLIEAGWLTANDAVTDENKDGIPDEIPSGLTGAARTLWQNNIDSKTEADTEDAVDDIEARIANGESLDEIKKAYNIDGTSRTWESVTGMSEAEWQQRFNDNQMKNYTYPNTNAGRADIVDALVDSASFSLSDKDQKNFDYIYGDGAYDAVQLFVRNISPSPSTGTPNSEGFGDPDRMSQGVFEEQFNYLFDNLAREVPILTEDQIFALIQKANPKVFTAATTEGYFSGRRAE